MAKPKQPRQKPTATTTTPATPPPPPNWPPLRALPPESQSLTTLLPSQILTTPLLPSSLCTTYRTFLSTLPLLTTPPSHRSDHAARVNDRFQLHDPVFSSNLWHTTGLSTLVLSGPVDSLPLSPSDRSDLYGGTVLGLNPNIRIYRYTPGQFFAQHYDDSNDVTMPDGTKGRTTWTLLIYLSGPATGCEGGETVFYPEPASRKAPAPAPVVAGLEVGMALLHRHGKECMLHEGREVTQGEKWVIRSDLVVRR
ncbi:hypothetical protein K461DRAFT_172950 [Myriangium duriaei CBS 260.36]|uniref:Fe2OG dioxygenase domain-containing protein n=1 Tax=Myriangium duriaei CBS 260.36 TaxID=1168546 RepID=A0A9P4J0X5_9PEZI|nr:hypothetical protein K461DRAFT_172950 [Myriangium duriaei CBS 260.36]